MKKFIKIKMQFFDMHTFRDPTNANFFKNLQTAPRTLQPTQADEFFSLSLGYIPKFRKEFGVLILNAILSVIEDENIRFIFIHNHYFEILPFGKAFCQVPIIRIFLAFLKYDITILELHWEIICDCVPLNPKKWLAFIAQYSQKFTQSQNPYVILDILFKQERNFSTPEILPDYINVLTQLCTLYPEYREMRIQHCWSQIASYLSSRTKTDSLIICYNSLCVLAEFYENRKCPLFKIMNNVCSHLNSNALRNYALNLLSLKNFVVSEVTDSFLIDNLITLARDKKEPKAALIMMQIANTEDLAYLFVNDTNWMKFELPIIIDTLRLFLVVFKHSSLRPALSKSPYFLTFLLNILDINHTDIFKIICLIIHRIPLTPKLIRQMSERKIIESFIQKAIAIGGAEALNATLVFTDAIVTAVPNNIPKEFIKFCDTVANLSKNNKKLSNSALLVAAKLSDSFECLNRLRKLGMDEFFERIKDNSCAQKFFQNVRDFDCGTDGSPIKD